MLLNKFIVSYVLEWKSLYQFGATLLVYLIIKSILYLRVRQKRYSLFKYYGIPGPKPNLWNGNYSLYTKDVANFKADDYCRAKFGKTYGIFYGDEPSIISVDVKLLQNVFLDNIRSFRNRTKLFIESPLITSIFFAPYHRWQAIRKIMSPSFSGFNIRGSESLQFVENSIRLTLDYIENKFECQATKTIQIDIIDLMKSTTLHIISHMAISLPELEIREGEPHVESLNEFMQLAGEGAVKLAIRFPFLQDILQFVANHFQYGRALKIINKSLNNTIDQNLKLMSDQSYSNHAFDRTRLIELLIKQHHEKKLSRDEVVANCFAILIAGYDTTSTTLTYIFWAIANHHDIQDRLYNDLMTYGSNSKYLEQVINETMRLYPVVVTFQSRLAAETVTIGQVTVPQGSKVIFNAWLVHRDPEIWPEPLKFDPERFAPGIEHHPCTYAPFGLGMKNCIGSQLAKLQLKMIVCDFLLRYRIRLIAPANLELVTYSLFLTKPKNKVMLELERR